MKKRSKYHIYVLAALSLLLIASRLMNGLPWWIFVLPVMAFGAWLAYADRDIAFFPIGFAAGFLVWTFSNLYFHFLYHGCLEQRIGNNFMLLALGASGVIGGLLTGLAFYTGKSVVGDRGKNRTLESDR